MFSLAVPHYIMRESKSERRQQIQRQGMAYRRHTHSLGCCPPASWQATRKALTPALSHGRGSRWSPRHSLPHKPHSITHQKQPAPHSCAESEKAACTLKNQVQAAFFIVKPSSSCYSTVTDLARLRGLSTSVPRAKAAWYDKSCTGIVCTIGESVPA